jgi:hypothetical protein
VNAGLRYKLVLSFAAVLFGFLSLGYVEVNNNDYTTFPQSPDTHVAYIDSIYQVDGKLYVTADPMEWYEGEEANKVFREREHDPEMTEVPDGYYIVNDDTALETLEIADNAKVYMQIYNRTGNIVEATTVWNEPIDVAKFVSLFSVDSDMYVKGSPYHLTVENNQIVKITQQYVP